jgi:SUMO ligase MMS21 Smc5/6 complex component
MGQQEDEELDEIICPITLKMMVEPMSAADGHTYERSAICEWIERATRGTPEMRNVPLAQ